MQVVLAGGQNRKLWGFLFDGLCSLRRWLVETIVGGRGGWLEMGRKYEMAFRAQRSLENMCV